MFLNEIERRQREMQRRLHAIPNALVFAREAKDGKTAGVKIPEAMRTQLNAVQKKHKLTSIKQTVLFVLHVGLQQLEGTLHE